jgi:YidC/Oxa1 family membrane protein insertase
MGIGEWLATNWDWILATVFLVLTIRGILFPVFVKQIKSQRAMQALQPKIGELREKHKGDRVALQQAQMELMRSEGANPLMGCLPMVVQIPVFLGLFHVLRHLKPQMSEHGKTLYGWTVAQFDAAVHARLFGAPIAASFRSSASDLASMHASATNVRIVAGVLVVIMIATTYLTQRQMIRKTGWATDPTQLMIQRLMLYGVPIGLLVSGTIFPIGVVIYWVTTNLFSLGQQFYVLRKFPPPANANMRPAGTGKLVKTDKATPARNGSPVAKRNGKPVSTAVPIAKPSVAPPRVGAKPVNPKKGNAAKRLPS